MRGVSSVAGIETWLGIKKIKDTWTETSLELPIIYSKFDQQKENENHAILSNNKWKTVRNDQQSSFVCLIEEVTNPVGLFHKSLPSYFKERYKTGYWR